jgi:hypothetical protein
MFAGGKLKLKGGPSVKAPKAERRKKRVERQAQASAPGESGSGAPPLSGAESGSAADAAAVAAAADDDVVVARCTGELQVSGTAVTGRKTRFRAELHPGDTIVIAPSSSSAKAQAGAKGKEAAAGEVAQVVKLVMSDISAILAAPLPVPAAAAMPVSFRVRYSKSGRARAKARALAERSAAAGGAGAEGGDPTHATAGTVKYRVRMPGAAGGYATVVENVGARGKDELLDLRTKRVSDKYCK